MTTQEILQELEQYGDENTKRTLTTHGAREPFFGVKAGDLKKILKKTKKNHELALELYATGNTDAMYLAGLMADEKKITRDQLQDWADKAYWYYLFEYTVPWVAAETEFGFDLGLEWIKHDEERFAAAGWATLASYAALNSDELLDIAKYTDLLDLAGNEVHNAKNRVKFAINGFVIAIGSYVPELTEKAKEVAAKIGKVDVTMGTKACKVPLATEYIQKVEDKGRVGIKRKTARC